MERGAPTARTRSSVVAAALVAAVTVAAPHHAARAASPEAHTRVTTWGLRDGLPQSSVTALVQTRDGYLWVGTFGGLARFDGVRFVVFDLANTPGLDGHRVIALAEDPAGTLWIGSEDGGLARYRRGHFHTLRVEGATPLPSVSGVAFAPDGTVWAASSEGLLRVEGDVARIVPTDPLSGGNAAPRVTGVAVTADGRVWAATVERSACVAGPCAGAPSLPGGARVGGFGVVGADGSRWFSTTAGLYRIDAAGALTLERAAALPVTYNASAVALDAARDRVWLATGNELWMREGPGPWVPYHEHLRGQFDDPRDAVRSLLVDREGGLWIGRDRHGLAQVLRIETTRYGAAEGLGFSAFAVLVDRAGREWVTGNCAGAFARDPGGTFARVDFPTPTICMESMALAPDGAVWFGDLGRLVRVEGEEATSAPLPPPLDTESPRAFTIDADGTFWIGAGWRAAVVELTPDLSVRRVYGASDGLGGVFVSTIVPDGGGGVWLGTHRGLFHLARDRTLAHWGPEDGLARGVVRDVHVDPGGVVWVGTYGGGLSRLAGGHIRTFTTADGLCDDTVSRILDDGRGNLWMNGNRGVSRVARADLEAVLAGSRGDVPCTLLDSGEGNGGVQPAGTIDRDGHLWFPTIDGVVSIDPTSPHATPVEPLAHIEKVSFDGAPVEIAAGGALGAIPPGRGDVTVRYTGLHFELPTQVTFRHRLLGYSDEWVYDDGERTISYTNLPPGEYELEVAAHSPRGVWSAPAHLSFTLEPHLWQTTLARSFGVLLLLGLLGGLVQLRVRKVRRRNGLLREEVAERQRAETRAREQEHRYRTLFEGANYGLFLHDTEGRLVEVNPAACGLVGAPAEELVDRGLAAWLAAESRETYGAIVSAATAGAHAAPVDVALVRTGGERRELACQASPFDLRGVPHALVTAVDLTAVRRAEAERLASEQHLQQVQKLEGLGLLAGGIAHDFNNHLAAIGATAVVLRQSSRDPETRRSAMDIERSVERAGALVRRILAFGRQQPGGLLIIDPVATLAGFVPLLARLLPPSVTVQLGRGEGDNGGIQVDPVLFEQSITNLVVNARDAIEGAGVITVTSSGRTLDAGEARRRGVAPGAYAVVTVCDTGVGMSAATRQRIFDPFFTTKGVGQGTGLGLSITQAMVDQAQGFIDVTSEPGAGATFALHFPVVGPAPNAPRTPTPLPQPRPPTPSGASSCPRILLCDDDAAVRRATRRMLEMRGFAVRDEGTPDAALAAFEAEPGWVDLLLTDVVLPEFPGPELARRVRATRPDLPVVFISGHTRDVDIPGLDEAPFLSKPFTLDRLTEAVRAALGIS